jgi:hypothetical protein
MRIVYVCPADFYVYGAQTEISGKESPKGRRASWKNMKKGALDNTDSIFIPSM